MNYPMMNWCRRLPTRYSVLAGPAGSGLAHPKKQNHRYHAVRGSRRARCSHQWLDHTPAPARDPTPAAPTHHYRYLAPQNRVPQGRPKLAVPGRQATKELPCWRPGFERTDQPPWANQTGLPGHQESPLGGYSAAELLPAVPRATAAAHRRTSVPPSTQSGPIANVGQKDDSPYLLYMSRALSA